MLGIHSLWTKPASENDACGFNSVQDLLACTELSARLLRPHVSGLRFYTDRKGYELTKPIHHLYDDVLVVLDSLNWVESYNWGLSKIYVYTLQTEPFVHVDNDVFLWDGLPDYSQADFFFQGRELISLHRFYLDAVQEVARCIDAGMLPYIPGYAVNCGIAGFNDLSVISSYYENAVRFIRRNQQHTWVDSFHRYHQCILFEQLFLVPLIGKKRITYVLNDLIMEQGLRYTHLIAGAKRNQEYIDGVYSKLLKMR